MRIGRLRARLALFIAGATLITYFTGIWLGSAAQVAVATAVVCAGIFAAAGVPLAQVLELKTSISNDRRRRLGIGDELLREQEQLRASLAALAEAGRADQEAIRGAITRTENEARRLREQISQLSAATSSITGHLQQIVATTTEQSIQMHRVLVVVEARPRRLEELGGSRTVPATSLEGE